MGVLADWQIEELARDKGMITPYAAGQKRPGQISFGQTSYGYDLRLGYRFKVFTSAFLTNPLIDPKAFDPKALIEIDLTPIQHTWNGPFERVTNGKYLCVNCHQWCWDTDTFSQTCVKTANHIIIPPNSFVLAESIETFKIPRDILVVCLGKSTYARCALIVNVTPGEPEWEGKWTIELSNTAPMPVKVYCGEGIMQAIFLRADGVETALLQALLRLLKPGTVFAHENANPTSQQMTLKTIEELLHAELPRGTCRISYKDKAGKYQNQTGLTLPAVQQ